jgi:Nuclear transport factor 2 (NTF2) domain
MKSYSNLLETVDSTLYQSVVERYFSTLNQAAFEETAALFAEAGALYPPFDQPVIGPIAIANYLDAEAQGMQVEPLQTRFSRSVDQLIQAEVTGRVQTALFSVNVAWTFVLNSEAQIEFVRVNLLASLQELLHLRPE